MLVEIILAIAGGVGDVIPRRAGLDPPAGLAPLHRPDGDPGSGVGPVAVGLGLGQLDQQGEAGGGGHGLVAHGEVGQCPTPVGAGDAPTWGRGASGLAELAPGGEDGGHAVLAVATEWAGALGFDRHVVALGAPPDPNDVCGASGSGAGRSKVALRGVEQLDAVFIRVGLAARQGPGIEHVSEEVVVEQLQAVHQHCGSFLRQRRVR